MYPNGVGNTLAQLGTVMPFGYKGQTGAYLDSETGLLLMGCRYYAPAIGRFLSRDPGGFAAGANLYAFCMDDPVNFFDPSGCRPNSYDGLWSGLHALNLSLLGHPLCPPLNSLMEAHDGMQNWGNSAGNTKVSAHDTKVSAHDTQVAGLYAGLHFADATLAFAGPALGAMRGLGEAGEAVGACKDKLCFLAGTPVWVAQQDKSGTWHTVSKPIEMVQQGEYVLARNEQTGKTSVRRVLKTTIKHADVTVSVTVADKSGKAVETITASREHPFYVDGKGFVPAGGLAIGNSIVTRAGPSLVVKAVQWNRRVEGYDVYNFVVEEDHTYFVGLANGGTWVHNDENCVSIAKRFLKQQGDGEVWGLTPKGGGWVDRAHQPFQGPIDRDGAFEWWDSHYVHVQDGMVRDPMMLGHSNPIPVEEWQTHWNNWDFHDFSPVPPEALKRLR